MSIYPASHRWTSGRAVLPMIGWRVAIQSGDARITYALFAVGAKHVTASITLRLRRGGTLAYLEPAYSFETNDKCGLWLTALR